MAIGFDASVAGSAASSPHTISVTVGSGANRVMIIDTHATGASITVSSITVNGSSTGVTFIHRIQANSRSNEQWRLIAPSSGTYNVVVTYSSSITNQVHVTTLTGAHQTTVIGATNTASGSSTAVAVTLSLTGTNSWTAESFFYNSTVTTNTADDGQTERSTNNTYFTSETDTDSHTSSGSITPSYTLNSSKLWNILVSEILEASSATGNPWYYYAQN